MNIFLDPNVAYLVLVLGFLLAIMALFAPGTGVLELAGLAVLLLAGYSIYNLPINGWALVVLLLGVFPFLWGLRRSGRNFFLVLSILALIIGSVFLFRTETGLPAVDPVIAGVVSLIIPVFLWFVARKGIEALNLRPSHDLGSLIGAIGETRTMVSDDGSVYVHGEDWSARSRGIIPAETRVRVVGRDGFTLEVEPVDSPQPEEQSTAPTP